MEVFPTLYNHSKRWRISSFRETKQNSLIMTYQSLNLLKNVVFYFVVINTTDHQSFPIQTPMNDNKFCRSFGEHPLMLLAII